MTHWLIFLGGLVLYGYFARVSFYRWYRRHNYNYDFDELDAISYSIVLTNGMDGGPTKFDTSDTLVLEINTTASPLGWLILPRIQFCLSGKTYHQWFEYNAQGRQYICLSFVSNASDLSLLKISSRGLFLDKSARLHVFKSPIPSIPNTLVIAPHPDDAELSSFGFYSQHPKSTAIVTITAGESGGPILQSFYTNKYDHYIKKGQLRTWNSLTIPQLAHIPVENILNLGYFDATLKSMHDQPNVRHASTKTGDNDRRVFRQYNQSKMIDHTKRTATWQELLSDCSTIISTICPDVIILPDPVMDNHPDHIYSTKAVIDALIQQNIKTGHLLFYTMHHRQSPAYPFGFRGGMMSLPPNKNQPMYFKKVISHYLPSYKQHDKLFALESFYVLRLSPSWLTFWGMIGSIFHLMEYYLKGAQGHFKRNVRCNELFFYLPIKDIYDHNIYRQLFKANHSSQ